MSGPIVIIDQSEIRTGKLTELKGAMKKLVELAQMNEPKMIAYQVYFNTSGNHMTYCRFTLIPLRQNSTCRWLAQHFPVSSNTLR